MPGYSLPWPVKRKATTGRPHGRPCSAAVSVGAAARRRASTSSPVSRTTAAKRCGRPVLTRLLLRHRAAAAPRGRPATASACAARLRRRASGVSALTVKTPTASRAARPRAPSVPAPRGVRGAEPRTAWAFVPPMPKLLTPARVSPRGSRIGAFSSRRPRSPSRSCGFSRSAKRLAGTMRWCRASAVLMRPAMPAAPSVWPRLPLTEPMAHGVSRGTAWTAPSAAHSMASPSTVPVPCASTNATRSGAIPARR